MFDESDKRLCKNPLYENTNLGHMVTHLECLKFISIKMMLKEQIFVHTHMFGIWVEFFFVSSLFILLLVNETQCLFEYMGTLAAMIDNENNYYVIFFFFFNFDWLH